MYDIAFKKYTNTVQARQSDSRNCFHCTQTDNFGLLWSQGKAALVLQHNLVKQ